MRVLALTLLLLTACVPPRRAGVGAECELNSACAAPLVCRLGHCRNECATSVDCPPGTACVLDQSHFGACQLAAETSCTLASECPEGLVCRFSQCTNACETDRDCPGGARCVDSAAGLACFDPSGEACTRDSECSPDEETGSTRRCVVGRCRRECFTDRDCRNDFWCNWDQGGACWPLPRLASADAGVRDAAVDGAADGGAPTGCVPSTPLWTTTQVGIDDTTLVATAAGHLLLSSVTDPSTGPGGTLHDLDLTTRAWTAVAFADARQGMAATPDTTNSRLYITGGSLPIAGGGIHTGVYVYTPGPGAFALSLSTSEARRGSTSVVCNTNLIVSGGTLDAPERLSSTIDVLELTAFGRMLSTTMPEGHRGQGAATRFAQAILAGGERETAPGVFEPSDSMFVLDCVSPAITTRALPRRYRRMWGLSAGDRAYFVGEAEVLGSESPYEHVELYDWSAGTITSIDAPPPTGAGTLTDVVLVGDRVVRAFDGVVEGLDLLGGGGAGCLAPTLPAHRLASDAGVLLVITIAAGTATVSAYDVP
jgi:hypothetical protein